MANLTRPANCECGSIDLEHHSKPERWVCSECGEVCVSRQGHTDPNKCRVCEAERGTKPFSKWSNICVDCKDEYNKKYREANREKLKAQKSAYYHSCDKKARRARMREAAQRSPETFLRHLTHELAKRANKNGFKVQIVYEDLLLKWQQQKGLCALSCLPMTHKFKDLCAISIDRKDSAGGYTVDNVQLVCQWANRGKNTYWDDEFKKALMLVNSTELWS